MKHVILGTAGHIDHGKTSLVKALTGVDTDRLKEEKERGITIELGFTFLDLPSGIRLGIIDVPGHERFVKHMVAGAWGIDLVALVIAADEGVMPQTREHLDICRLLRVKKGLIVLSKIDLVDPELMEIVREEISDVVKGTFLEGAPILPVSSVTGEGLPLLISVLDELAKGVEERPADGLFRLPVDRVFVMKGFGTVVTGTVVSGNILLGETVEILPLGKEAKVRTIQVHNQPTEKAEAGQRAAINLQGLEASEINRGDVLVRPKTLDTTRTVDVYLEHLPNATKPLKHRTTLRFHIGTNLATATIYLMDREELPPGEATFAQLRLDRPIVALPQDRFVIRGSSAIQTCGGGVILDNHPEKHKRFSGSVIADFTLLKDGQPEEVLRFYLERAGEGGIALEDLQKRVSLPPRKVQELLKTLVDRGELLLIDPEKFKVIDLRHYQGLQKMVLDQLKDFHQRFPMKIGLAKEELRTKLPPTVDVRLFQILLNELIRTQRITLEKDKIRLAGHRVSAVDDRGLVQRVEGAVLKGGLQPPSPRELAELWSLEEKEVLEVFERLSHEGTLVKIRSGIYFHRQPFENLKENLVQFLKEHKEITTPQFKEMAGASRKFVIPLIEYFDQTKLTLRLGDKRVLRASREP
ncbi:MAG: selenocysteine-specific translation elongation factor [Desulfobacterota bacterium]|nr:selenocysteine-specific translation elongation factor [Thermodesulfobacteriota bacterium]